MSDNKDLLLWVDVETTGLSAESVLLEVGLIVTDSRLHRIDSWHAVLTAAQPDLDKMEPLVRDMHTASGLLAEVHASTLEVRQADDYASEWAARILGPQQPPLCGSSVHFDRRMLARWMPGLEQRAHYRNIDVSTVKELTQRWRGDVTRTLPQPRKLHRAIPDLEDSLRELAHYRDEIFASPGVGR